MSGTGNENVIQFRVPLDTFPQFQARMRRDGLTKTEAAHAAIAAWLAPAPTALTRAPSDSDRLRAAMKAAGLTSRGVRDAAGLGHASTVDQVLRGGPLTLAKAGGGRLLAWVEGVEQAKGGGR